MNMHVAVMSAARQHSVCVCVCVCSGSIVSSQALETIPFVASDFAINSFDTMNSGREVVAVASNNTLIYIDRQPEPLY